MTWHRTLANRGTTALLGTLMQTVLTDGQSGFRAFSRSALETARIPHDYNYAQVLTLSLWGAGIEPVEVPISYRRRDGGRSFVRYPEYFGARGAGPLAPVPRVEEGEGRQRARQRAGAARTARRSRRRTGTRSVSGPNGASGRGVTSPPPPSQTSK